MKKCLLFVRSSTNRQETQSQLKETKEYAIDLGYKDFVVLERAGASAYKVSTKYVELVEDMKAMIEADPDIDAVVCWHLNRLSRNPSKALEIEEYLVEHKIQLYIKTPQLKLLNDDGTENEAAGLIFMVYAKISQYQIDELRDKSSRAKTRDKALHKFIGGRGIPFGYMVEDKFVKPDPKNAKIVNEIFDLYGTGQWSYHTLAPEIDERYGLDFDWYRIKRIIQDKHYYDETHYPAIITKAQYDLAMEKRDANYTQFKPRNHKHYTFANRLIKCPVCGYGLTTNTESYKCIHNCKDVYYGINNVDGLVWLIASHLEGQRLLNSSAKDEYLQKQAVLRAKIEGVAQSITKGEKVQQNLKKALIQGYIDLDEFTKGMDKVEQQTKDIRAKQAAWQAEITELQRLIDEDKLSIQRILKVADKISSVDEQEMRSIVRKWIKKVTVEDNVFTVTTLTQTYKAVYKRYNWVSRWLTLSGKPLVIAPVNRTKTDCKLGAVHTKNPMDAVTTLTWLNGSEII